MKCNCELNGEGCCSECYDGPVTPADQWTKEEIEAFVAQGGNPVLPTIRSKEEWEAHIKMEREAHADDTRQETPVL